MKKASTTTSVSKGKKAQPEKAPILYKKVGIAHAKRLGQELANFAKQNNLSVNIAGKQFMQVEGWQFVGAQLGLTDVVIFCDPVETTDPKEIKYKAIVNVINQNGTVVSRGFAYASNRERKKTSFEEYAIASMAQTRAIGKAYRNFLAWIVKMAGYETTPVEEIDRDKMESDLSGAKRRVLSALNEAGYSDTSEMLRIIEVATGNSTIDTVDDANKVIGYLEELSEN